MESLYILEPGSYLRREGDSLKVMRRQKLVDQIPADGLKRLMLVGYVSLTGPVLDFLIQRRIETVFVTLSGRFRARLNLDEHRHVQLRKNQYLGLAKPETSLDAAKRLVRGKLLNMYYFLRIRASDYGDDTLKKAAVGLKSMAAYVNTMDDIGRVRGMEGAGTRIYFSVFHSLIRNEAFYFKGRNRRPPLDPVNALLSFVYTLLTNEVLSAISICGLDPYMGALHEIAYGRPSLACDLVEEYRAFLGDRPVLGLINKKMLSPDDFVIRKSPGKNSGKRPVEMKPATVKTFFAAYEAMMNRRIFYPPLEKKVTYRQLILHQARSFGACLEDGAGGYEPFLWQ